MQAIVLQEPGKFVISDVSEAARPLSGEARVRVHRVGICGTDYSGFLGKMPFYSYPRIPGHELGVEVLEVGAGVENVSVGDRCAVEPYMNCQNCYSCRRGCTNCCENLQVLGVHTDGGLRAEFVVPARKLHRSSQLTYEQLALVETLAIGCHAVNRGAPEPGEPVLVIGAGPIGLATIEFVKLSGARTIVLELNEQRLQFVRERMGVPDTVRADGSELEEVKRLSGGQLARIVIDATGNNHSMGQALNYVAFTGKLIFVGITTAQVSFGHPLMHRREMSILASRNAVSPDFTRIISLIEKGQIDTRPWITHQAKFGEMIGEFDKWLNPETRVIKAMVTVT